MSERVEVCPVSAFEGTDRQIVEVRGVEVGVLEVEGEYYALLNRCSHQNGPVAEGEVRRKIVGDVPEVGERVEERYEEGTRVIRCPWHQWGFDVETGENMADPDIGRNLVTYDVVVEDGTVYLEL